MLISDTKGKLTTGLSFPAPSGRRQSASPSVCKPILSLCQLFNVKILPITSIQTVIYLTTVIAYNYGKRFLPNKNYIGFLTFVPVPFIYIFWGGGMALQCYQLNSSLPRNATLRNGAAGRTVHICYLFFHHRRIHVRDQTD